MQSDIVTIVTCPLSATISFERTVRSTTFNDIEQHENVQCVAPRSSGAALILSNLLLLGRTFSALHRVQSTRCLRKLMSDLSDYLWTPHLCPFEIDQARFTQPPFSNVFPRYGDRQNSRSSLSQLFTELLPLLQSEYWVSSLV